MAARGTLELRAYSPAVVTDSPPLSASTTVTGYWFLESDVDPEPPRELVQFLEAGPAPVCVGFGSMIESDPQGMSELAVEALRRAGQRGVLIRGAQGFDESRLPDSVHAVGAISHDWLFERCSAVVHHGGAGTTATALKAGVPVGRRAAHDRPGRVGSDDPRARRRAGADPPAQALPRAPARGDRGGSHRREDP